MSLFPRTAFRTSGTSLRLALPLSRSRQFHITSARAALSESDHSLDDGERKKIIDEHKDDQLNKQKEGKGHWKKELSSNSESAVKADREEISDAQSDVSKMQKQSSEAMEEDHEHGKSK